MYERRGTSLEVSGSFSLGSAGGRREVIRVAPGKMGEHTRRE